MKNENESDNGMRHMTTQRPLFRSQSVDHRRAKSYGTVTLAQPISHRVLTLLFAGIAAALVLFFIFFSTTRKTTAHGVLFPSRGLIRVHAAQSGIITEKLAKEGQSVQAGDVLFILTSERSSSHAADAHKTISQLLQGRRESFGVELSQTATQFQQRISAMRQRVSEFQNEIGKLDDQIELQQQRVAIAEQSMRRFHELQNSNYISAAQLQDKQAELLDQRQRLAELQRAKMTNERNLATINAEIADMQLQGQRETAALQRNASMVEQDLTENEARRDIIVRASQSGVVTAITAEVGQAVTTENTLAAILPGGADMEAEIYVPSRSAGFIKVGMPVLLRYEAYPYQKFGQYAAQVKEIALTSLNPNEFALSGSASQTANPQEPIYRVRLQLENQNVMAYGKAYPLKSGMQVEASIILEKRRLYEWILEPLYSVSGRF